MAGLYCQGAYGIDILRYTETARTVAEASTAPEVLRSLGYWFFYGDDKVGPWIEPSVALHPEPGCCIFGTYLLAVPRAARRRRDAVALPRLLREPGGRRPGRRGRRPPVGRPAAARRGASRRSSPPTPAWRCAACPGPCPCSRSGSPCSSGWASHGRSPPRGPGSALGPGLAAGVAVLAVLCLPPLWTGDMVAENLQRPEDLPQYWLDAAAVPRRPEPDDRRLVHTRARDAGRRLRLLPVGQHRRPRHARAHRPALRRPRADPLRHAAVGRPAQRLRRPAAGGHPRRRRHRADGPLHGRGRHRAPRRPRSTSATTSPGPGRPGRCSGTAPGVRPVRDLRRARAENVPDPDAPAAGRARAGRRPRPARTRPRSRCSRSRTPSASSGPSPPTAPVLLAGDGDGLVDLGVRRARRRHRAVLYSAVVRRRPRRRWTASSTAPGAVLVLTDTNRRAGRRWSTVRENEGYTEQAGEEPLRVRPDRQPPAALPRRRRRRHDGRRAAGRRARPGHRLRQPDHLHARGPGGQRGRRRPPHGLAGRRVLPGRGRADRAHLRRAPHHRQHHGRSSPTTACRTAGSPRCGCASTAATRSTSPSAPSSRTSAGPGAPLRPSARSSTLVDRGPRRRRRPPRPLRRAQRGRLRRHPPRRRRPPPRRGDPPPRATSSPRPAPARPTTRSRIVLTRQRTRPSIPLRGDTEVALARGLRPADRPPLRRVGPGPASRPAPPTT